MFALIWSDPALNRLAEIYVSATAEQRERMAAGVERLNERLRTEPADVGESRAGGNRVTFPPLLVVGFRVDPASRRVWVTSVRRYGH